jgi:hypothetical protein
MIFQGYLNSLEGGNTMNDPYHSPNLFWTPKLSLNVLLKGGSLCFNNSSAY